MREEGKYLQWPLCALAYKSEFKERMECIIAYGTVEAGLTATRKISDPAWWKLKAEQIWKEKGMPPGFNKERQDHFAALVGCDLLNIGPGHIGSMVQRWSDLSYFKSEFESEHRDLSEQKRGDVIVRTEKSLTFDVRDGKRLSEREFAILAAIYSVIGSKRFACVSRPQIMGRMMGYKSGSIFKKCTGKGKRKRDDGAEPLTIDQIAYTVDKLHETGWFARARANKRQTFYSHRLTQDELQTALIKSKTYSSEFNEKRKAADMTLMSAIKAKRAAIKVGTAIIVGNPQSVVTEPPLDSSLHSPLNPHLYKKTLNTNPSIESLPIKSPCIQAHAPDSCFDAAAEIAKARLVIDSAPEPPRRKP